MRLYFPGHELEIQQEIHAWPFMGANAYGIRSEPGNRELPGSSFGRELELGRSLVPPTPCRVLEHHSQH